MEESRKWDVQVLDEKGNVKYEASLFGIEQEARSLLTTFEKRYWRKEACVNN